MSKQKEGKKAMNEIEDKESIENNLQGFNLIIDNLRKIGRK